MSSNASALETPLRHPATSAQLASTIASQRLASCAVTVIGYGVMGRHYVAALRALGVSTIRVCSRSPQPLEALRNSPDVQILAGGFEALDVRSQPEELAIIAAPTHLLGKVARHLAALGFRRLLIEKPVSLWARDIEQLAEALERQGVTAVCAYNRVAYPACVEVAARAAEEGGISSCTYSFTEMIKPDWPQRFPKEELARWGIANSLHVISMAHGLIGAPLRWSCTRTGSIAWHPTGAVFVGSGVSEREIPFAYHADWGSKSRWSVELHTRTASYRLCPLENVFRKAVATGEWEDVPVASFSSEIKAGILEEVAAMLSEDVRAVIPLASLRQAAALTRYAEDVFGYA